MKPGRELDALIAEKVMGKKLPTAVGWWTCDNPPDETIEICPFYSTDIAAAWEVVEKMKTTNHSCFLSTHVADVHQANFVYGQEPVGGDSIPHAICLAALKAVGA